MATVEERLSALYVQRDDLIARIAAAGSTPGQVAVSGSVSYTERPISELRQALETVEASIAALENPSGLIRTLPRYR